MKWCVVKYPPDKNGATDYSVPVLVSYDRKTIATQAVYDYKACVWLELPLEKCNVIEPLYWTDEEPTIDMTGKPFTMKYMGGSEVLESTLAPLETLEDVRKVVNSLAEQGHYKRPDGLYEWAPRVIIDFSDNTIVVYNDYAE